ncbi:ATP-binding protein [Dinoroseobacter sp. S375]|uniref:sensor histidine kinase n=1 Tax=Dinoroseobacter sp. S375 TaxID=3415136 RepID=UPI003C7DC28C
MSLVASLTARLRWLRRSSTLRLTLLLSGIFTLGMVVAILIALSIGREALLRRVDDSLSGLAAAMEIDDVPSESFAVIVRPLDALGDLPPAFERVAARGGGTVSLRDDFRRSEDWRVMVAPDSKGTPILLALPLDDSDEALELLGGVLWTTALLVLGLNLALGLGIGLVAQRRMIRITDTLDRLAAGDLQARTGSTRAIDDLDDIARQLDMAAAELERLVAQTRNLSASLAHDLRTPLARLRARLEALPDGPERGAALEEASRLAGIFDTIMRVARIEAGQGREGFEPVDLGALAEELSEIFGPVIEEEGKRPVRAIEATATVTADRQMLIQAMANLIQNALVYGGDEITLFVRGAEIGVADNGAGVDPARYGDIIKPMVRVDAARQSDGSGLGLALVRAVADRHGARLVLSENTPTGLRVSLKFAEL